MKILIVGGSGFVGEYLSRFFIKKGYHVIATGMRPHHILESADRFAYVSTDTTLPGPWQDRVLDVDAVINLAGRNIFRYWTDKTKRQIHRSRILTTRNVVMALGPKQDTVLLNTSAIGYYGDQGDTILKESSPAGDDFLAHVSMDWEKEALQAEAKSARVALLRFSVILGKNGGALNKMLPAFKSFAGGPLGSGRQWFSWMHIQDLAAAVDMILVKKDLRGPFNFCAPHPERNHTFAKALGHALGRPAFMKMPSIVLRLAMGEMGSVMLASQRCLPDRLQRHGFEFRFPNLEMALEDLLNG